MTVSKHVALVDCTKLKHGFKKFGSGTSADVHRQLREATGVDAELPDLGEILQKKLSVPDKAAASSYLQDPRYKELTKILGIGEEDDEDEELQVMDTQVGSLSIVLVADRNRNNPVHLLQLPTLYAGVFSYRMRGNR